MVNMMKDKIIKLLEELDEIATSFDVTISVSGLSDDEIRDLSFFCGERTLEFQELIETKDLDKVNVNDLLIRVRK